MDAVLTWNKCFMGQRWVETLDDALTSYYSMYISHPNVVRMNPQDYEEFIIETKDDLFAIRGVNIYADQSIQRSKIKLGVEHAE